MIYLKYTIYLLGVVVGMLSLYSNKKYIKLATSIGLVVICLFGILETYSSENRLSLKSYNIENTGHSYKAQITFRSSKNEPFGVFSINATIPENSQAKILNLSPLGSFEADKNPLIISDDAKKAILTYHPRDINILFFEIEVTQKTSIILQGNYGINNIIIEIK